MNCFSTDIENIVVSNIARERSDGPGPTMRFCPERNKTLIEAGFLYELCLNTLSDTHEHIML